MVSLPHSIQSRVAAVLLAVAVLCGLGVKAARAHVYQINTNAIVLLVAKSDNGATISTGTGFIVKPNGTLITNYHVLLDASSMEAVFPDGSRTWVESILNLDRSRDLSILKLKGDHFSTLELGDSDRLKPYDYTSALGYPAQAVDLGPEGLRGMLLRTHGFILGIHPQALPDTRYIYTTTPFGPGFSGGPLVNQDHQIVGLATMEGRSINLALPINYIKPYLEDPRPTSFQEMNRQSDTFKENYYYRGNFTLYGLGETEAAIRMFKQALALDPNYVPAHYDLAVAYRGMGDIDAAIAAYEKALEINPRFPEALSNLGGQYFRQGKIDRAVALFQRALEVYPNFIQALSNLGAVLNKQGKPQEALPYLKRALALDPEFGVAYFNLGNSLLALNRLTEAEGAYQNALRAGVDFLSLHWNLHDIYQKTGNLARARQELRIILQIDPENARARRKLEEMGQAVPR